MLNHTQLPLHYEHCFTNTLKLANQVQRKIDHLIAQCDALWSSHSIAIDLDVNEANVATCFFRLNFDPELQAQSFLALQDYALCTQKLLDTYLSELHSVYSHQARLQNRETPWCFPMAKTEDEFIQQVENSNFDLLPEVFKEGIVAMQPFLAKPTDEFFSRTKIALGILNEWKQKAQIGFKLNTPPVKACDLESLSLNNIQTFFNKGFYLLPQEKISFASFISCKIEPSTLGQIYEKYKPELILTTSNCFDFPLNRSLPLTRQAIINIIQAMSKIVEKIPLTTNPTPQIQQEHGAKLIISEATDGTLFAYEVPPATKIPSGISSGYAAEKSIKNVAATWGLPDFVMHPQQERKGTAVREVSDALIFLGNKGLIVQSKARAEVSNNQEREKNWTKKQIKKASRQIDGTLRRLTEKDTKVINGRNRELTIPANGVEWMGVVIIENNVIDEVKLDDWRPETPCVVLLRREWEFLFQELQSTSAVVDYIFRVKDTQVLGHETIRFVELVTADHEADSKRKEEIESQEFEIISIPVLQIVDFATEEDNYRLVRDCIEDISHCLPHEREHQKYFQVMTALDSIPTGFRAELGKKINQAIQDSESNLNTFTSRIIFPLSSQIMFAFAACLKYDEISHNHFQLWSRLRHYQYLKLCTTDSEPESIFVLLNKSTRPNRRLETTVIQYKGPIDISDAELELLESRFGPLEVNKPT